ncbi:MAG: hypothetical protein PHP03_02195 [Candidatus Pacebacteria bacterium]|nr:hypothetical protein [Candidatus Paceibacterota bacterium]
MKVSKVLDAADGSATPGQVFTASINQQSIPNDGAQLDYLKLGLKGAVSTAAVAIESFAGLLSEFVLRFGSDNRVVGDAGDLCALMAFYYGEIPTIGENTDNTGNDFLGGIKIPVYQKSDASRQFLIQATRTAVTNIDTETISLSAYWDTGEANRKAIHFVKVAHTTSGTAGVETLGSRIVPEGNLIGLIIKEANGFNDGNIDTSVQRVKILVNGKKQAEFNTLGDHTPIDECDFVTPSPLSDLLRTYKFFDLRPAGIDCKGQEVTIQIDVQDASDAIRILPVIEIV